MPAPRANVLTHGHCMDGLASAVLFTRLLEAIEPRPGRVFSYRSCGYGPKLKTIPGGWLTADENALLDFRYAEHDRVHYYFDHHKTAFASARDEQLARERVAASGGRRQLHFDPECSSCARLIARVAKERYGLDLPGDPALVEWADRVDSARFDDPEVAFFAREPALVLADIVERHGDTAFLTRVVPALVDRSVSEVVASPEIAGLAEPLASMKEAYLAALRGAGQLRGDVAVVDLSAGGPPPAGKFASYVAFPGCRYSVVLLKTPDQLKLSVGYNPWSGKQREHDIATLCQREGGGGHAVVGAANFAHDDASRARAALARVVAALSG